MPTSSKPSLSLRSRQRNPACNSPLPHTCYMSRSSRCTVQFIKLLVLHYETRKIPRPEENFGVDKRNIPGESEGVVALGTVLCCTALYWTVLYCTVLYCTVPCCTVLYCTVLCCTVLYCTVLCCTVLYCTALRCAALYRTVPYCAVLYRAVPYCTVLYCTVLYCTALRCVALYCTVLYSTVLYCTVLYCTTFINRTQMSKFILRFVHYVTVT
jgi:hypothetical protein